jgi:protein-tyrosine phosphatase
MVDIHHHLLPGLDDGPKDMELSVEMARMASEDGITHVVATPHANGRYAFEPAVIAGRAAELRQAIAAEGIALTLATGCDFHLSYENVQDAVQHPTKYTVNGSDYLLVELPDHGLPPHLSETFYELRLAGMIPILTHPERNPTLQMDMSRLGRWIQDGMLVQITTSSVLGQMGSKAEKMAHQLLADRWVHFLATDAHNVEKRPPQMRAAFEFVAKRYGREYAERLCVENPRAVFDGAIWPEQEEPRNLFDDSVGEPWWRRMFRRKTVEGRQ